MHYWHSIRLMSDRYQMKIPDIHLRSIWCFKGKDLLMMALFWSITDLCATSTDRCGFLYLAFAPPQNTTFANNILYTRIDKWSHYRIMIEQQWAVCWTALLWNKDVLSYYIDLIFLHILISLVESELIHKKPFHMLCIHAATRFS